MTPQLVAQAIAQLAAPLPTGSIIPIIGKSAPAGYLQCDGSQLDHGDAPTLCELLWLFDEFKGDSTSYAVLPDLDGRVVQGVTDISQVGTYLEAQLPNIEGEVDFPRFGVSTWIEQIDPLFSVNRDTKTSYAKATWDGGIGNPGVKLGLNASNADSIYGGQTVQTAALQVLACIKI